MSLILWCQVLIILWLCSNSLPFQLSERGYLNPLCPLLPTFINSTEKRVTKSLDPNTFESSQLWLILKLITARHT